MVKSKYIVTKANEHTFSIWEKLPGTQCLMYLVVGKQRALLIDTGMGMNDLGALVKSLTEKPVWVVNTHAHFDHIGCNAAFIDVYMHKNEREVLRLHSDTEYLSALSKRELSAAVLFLAHGMLKKLFSAKPVARITYIEENHEFDLGGVIIKVIATPGHSPGSICLLDEDARILFSGDTICDRGIMLNLDLSMDTGTFLSSLKKLAALKNKFDAIYPGHHRHPIEPEYIDKYSNCAEGFLSGRIVPRKLKSGTGSFQSVECENIRIALPAM
jgi:glyoxylase-like metal-dependent hydrolase (beta-lactamase superfamily II)